MVILWHAIIIPNRIYHLNPFLPVAQHVQIVHWNGQRAHEFLKHFVEWVGFKSINSQQYSIETTELHLADNTISGTKFQTTSLKTTYSIVFVIMTYVISLL